jgi:hypothetical protein
MKTDSRRLSSSGPASDTAAERPASPVQPGAWRTVAATAILAALTVIWAAFPLDTGRGGTEIALIAAVAGAVLSVAQLAVITVPRVAAVGLAPAYERYADWLLAVLRGIPWAEIVVVAALVLEALHRAKPWHTGVLGIALLAYLFAIHLAETGAPPVILRPQLPVIAAGVGLLAVAVGAASLPSVAPGADTTALRMVAIVAAVIAGGLAIPVGGSRR